MRPALAALTPLMLLTLAAGCGLQDLDPLPDPPPPLDAALPEAGAPAVGEACSVRWQPRDEPFEVPVGGLPIDFVTFEPQDICFGRPTNCRRLIVDLAENRDDSLDFAARRISISRGFGLMRGEVTRAQWNAVMAFHGRDDPPPGLDLCPGPGCCEGDDCPIHDLSWSAAAVFANLASEAACLEPCYRLDCPNDRLDADYRCFAVSWCDPIENGAERREPCFECTGLRLPTEVEWAYAAQLDSTSIFHPLDLRCDAVPLSCEPADANAALLAEVAHFCSDGPRPAPVGAGAAQHPLRMHDLLGNVAEWVFDARGSYPAAGSVDPVRVSPERAVLGAAGRADAGRIARGGSWIPGPALVNSMRRTGLDEEDVGPEEIGLRLAIKRYDTDRVLCPPE